MNNIVAGRETLHGLGQHISRLRELRQEFDQLETTQGNSDDPENSFPGGMTSPMSPSKEFGGMIPLQESPRQESPRAPSPNDDMLEQKEKHYHFSSSDVSAKKRNFYCVKKKD